MPHLSIEYSSNVDDWVDMSAFCEMLRKSGLETGIFPLAGIRVRAMRCEHYAIADGHAENAFIDISVRLRAGRPFDKRKAATEHMFARAEAFLAEVIKTKRIALSMEMRDIDPELSPKLNTIRKFLNDE